MAKRYLEDFTVGQIFGSGRLRVDTEQIKAFAAEFDPQPFHLDENAANNRANNLKWGTQKENLNAPGFLEYCKNRTGEQSPWTKGQKKKAGHP